MPRSRAAAASTIAIRAGAAALTTLIVGPSGTGKELVARAIARREAAPPARNCPGCTPA
jgi:DNA-binding NtrC family response regulator